MREQRRGPNYVDIMYISTRSQQHESNITREGLNSYNYLHKEPTYNLGFIAIATVFGSI